MPPDVRLTGFANHLNERHAKKVLRLLLKVEGGRVDAEALAGGFARAVIEDVAKVAAAGGAEDLDAAHAVAGVFVELDVPGNGAVETRPAAVAVELRLRGEEFGAAGGADVHAAVVVEVELPGEGPF